MELRTSKSCTLRAYQPLSPAVTNIPGVYLPWQNKATFQIFKNIFLLASNLRLTIFGGQVDLWSRSLRQSYTFPERWLHWSGRRTHCSAGSLEGRRRLVVIWIALVWRRAEQERSCFFQDLSDVWNKYNQYNQQPDTFSALALDAVFSAKARSFL